MVDIEQAKQKLHDLEILQNQLNDQLVLFDEVESIHEDRKIRNARKINRQKAKLAKLEGKF